MAAVRAANPTAEPRFPLADRDHIDAGPACPLVGERWDHEVMADRVGVISSRAVDDAGRFRVLLPDGTVELVEGGLSDAEVMARFNLDRIAHAPHVDFCVATNLDGPLAGLSGYAVNRLGNRVGFALPPRPGGLIGEYEAVKLSEGGSPAELRFVEPPQQK